MFQTKSKSSASRPYTASLSGVESKQFQYETQPYQEDCISSIISIFESLHQNQPFCDALNEHHKKFNYPFPVQDTKNIDIMMETGTGKTFTFIKTMFELNKNFGYKKFIILIPTVPIREGTKTNLEDTRPYFREYYNNEQEKEIEAFVYESGQISSVKQFIWSGQLSALVLTPSSFNKDVNILNRPLEDEIYAPNLFDKNDSPPKTYLECIKRLNPIIIMDEPHRFEGDAFKKFFEGDKDKGIGSFDNYFLRFGATFPKAKQTADTIPLSNVAYTLDSISAFRQNLVKKIIVYTQDIMKNKDSLIAIEKKKAIVNTLTNGIIAKRELGIGSVYNGKNIRKINKDSIVLSDCSIEKIDYNLSDEALRLMIKETISVHFEKEKILFEQGIKALTLFFIKSDRELFRGDNPKIKTIFEEEYAKQRMAMLGNLNKEEDYYKYLQKDFSIDGELQVHKGYFSGDKGNADEKIKAGVDEILKDKKKLLSFESPTRFIFSIWALQEGWDNPNVFTICKLSNQGSEISKLQQIGRGLRVCVDQNLKRHTIKEFDDNQDEFWKVNNLDVIVSNQELGFVEAIQNEILNNSFFISDVFTEQDLTKLLKEKSKFDDSAIVFLIDDILKGKQMIIRKEIIDGQRIYEKSPDYSAILREQNLPDEQYKALESLFAYDYKNFVQEKGKAKKKKNIVIKERHLEEFKNLWNAINKNAFYVLDNLDNESEKYLANKIKEEIETLNIDEILLQTIRKDLNINRIDKDDAITAEIEGNPVLYKSKIDYLEFVQQLSSSTKMPIAFIIRIFNALSCDFKNKMLANNPKQALKEVKQIIHKNLVELIKTRVRYDGIEGEILPNVFQNKGDETFLKAGSVGKYQKDIDCDFSMKEKWIFKDVIEYDSDFEVKIVEQDPDIDEIEIFGKLPKLKIKVPFGEYNPDFCYAVKSAKGNKLILIVESKGYDKLTDVPQDERAKIEFAEKYFEYLNDSYKKQNANVKISFRKRINNTELANLINSIKGE